MSTWLCPELGAVQEVRPHYGDAPHRRPIPRVSACHTRAGRAACDHSKGAFSRCAQANRLVVRRQVKRREDQSVGERIADQLEHAYKGSEINVGFNARYLIDVLSVLDNDEVAFELGDEHSPGVLHAPQDRTYTAVVMPMRV